MEKMFHSVVDCLKAKTSAPATWPQLQLMHWVWEGHRKGSWHGWRSLNSFIVWFMWRCIVAEYNDMMEMSVWLLNKIMAKGPTVLWITWWCWLYLFEYLYAPHSELTVQKLGAEIFRSLFVDTSLSCKAKSMNLMIPSLCRSFSS